MSGGHGLRAGSETRPIVRAVDVEGLVLRAALVVQLGGARVGEIDLDAGRDDADGEQRDVEDDPAEEVGGVVRAEKMDCAGSAVVLKQEGELQGEDAEVGGAQLVDGGDGREAAEAHLDEGDGVDDAEQRDGDQRAGDSPLVLAHEVDAPQPPRALGEVVDDARGDDALQLGGADHVVLRERAPRLERDLGRRRRDRCGALAVARGPRDAGAAQPLAGGLHDRATPEGRLHLLLDLRWPARALRVGCDELARLRRHASGHRAAGALVPQGSRPLERVYAWGKERFAGGGVRCGREPRHGAGYRTDVWATISSDKLEV